LIPVNDDRAESDVSSGSLARRLWLSRRGATGRAATGSAGWVLSRLLAQGLEFAAWVLMARRLGAESVGVLAVAAIASRLLGLVGDWGAAARGPRDVAVAGRNSTLVISFVRRREAVSGLLAVGLAVALVAVGQTAVAPIALAAFARGAGRDWIALGEGRLRHAAVPLLVQGSTICVIVSFADSVGEAAAAIGIGNLLGLAFSLHLNPVKWGGWFGGAAVDGWYLLAGIADQILVSSDTALLFWVRSAEEAGIYNTIYRFPLAWITVIGLCTSAAIPLVARAAEGGRVDLARLHRRGDILAVCGVIAVVPVAFAGVGLSGVFFGEEFSAGRDPLILLFVAAAVTTASAPYRVLFTSFGPDRLAGIITAMAAAGNLVGTMLGFLAGWSRRARIRLGTSDPVGQSEEESGYLPEEMTELTELT